MQGHLEDSKQALLLLALRLVCGSKDSHQLAAHMLALQGPPVLDDPYIQKVALKDIHWQTAQKQWNAMCAMHIAMLPVWMLPVGLLRVTPLPIALFVRGDVAILHKQAVAIVGSRNASSGAATWAAMQAQKHAQDGLLVVSGGALGIDTAAHRGALLGGGKTLAYVGSAIDKIYPAANKVLFQDMLATGGAIVSEHPPFATTFKSHHALRNRFIAAHAATVTIVEALPDSGSLGTAQWAHRFGTQIFVPPEGVATHRSGLDFLIEKNMASMLPQTA